MTKPSSSRGRGRGSSESLRYSCIGRTARYSYCICNHFDSVLPLCTPFAYINLCSPLLFYTVGGHEVPACARFPEISGNFKYLCVFSACAQVCWARRRRETYALRPRPFPGAALRFGKRPAIRKCGDAPDFARFPFFCVFIPFFCSGGSARPEHSAHRPLAPRSGTMRRLPRHNCRRSPGQIVSLPSL